jgi:uncharacterized caspase-like protein
VGTDRYDNINPLGAAVIDARRFGRALENLKGRIYKAVQVDPFLDATDLRSTLLAKIREVAAQAGEHDTIMLFFAGHGIRDEATGRFYLATREGVIDRAAETMISGEEIADAIHDAKARVIVFIDACHSGAAGTANDDAVATFLGRDAPVTLIAASKGRQLSREESDGGVFATAVIRAIGANRETADTNGNGAIELAELYGLVKRDVVNATNHKQTPWIARNNMVGETPLF